MKKLFLFALVNLIVLVFFPSCSEDPDLVNELSVNIISIEAPAAGGEYSIELTSNKAWTATASESWCMLTPNSGSGNGTIAIVIAANENNTTRSNSIAITSSGVTKTIIVTQDEFTPTKPDAYLVDKYIDAGLLGEITVRVSNPIIKTNVTYHWSILDANLGTISNYRNTDDPSERKINTTGKTGSFLVTVYASCGVDLLDTVVVNINNDDFTQTLSEDYNFGNDKSQYIIDLAYADTIWYHNHTYSWYLEGTGDVTSPTSPSKTIDILPINLLSRTDSSFYVTVTNKTTGCRTRRYH